MADPIPLKIELVHIEGPMKGQIQEFDQDEVTVGRHPECLVRFPKDLTIISRRHARIVREGNRFKLVDSSTNGTFVNGKRVKEAFLRSGDVITFAEGGPKVSFLVSKGQGLPLGPAGLQGETAPKPEINAAPAAPAGHQPSPVPPAASGAAAGSGPAQAAPVPPQGDLAGGLAGGPASRVKAGLVIQYGPSIKSFEELPVAIGSSPESEFVIHDPELAPRHMLIHFASGSYTVQDLTGQARVRVNGMAAAGPVALSGGEEVELYPGGPALKFVGEGRFAEILKESAPGPAPGGQTTRQAVTPPAAGSASGPKPPWGPGRPAPSEGGDKDPLAAIKRFFKGLKK